jgi:N-acetyl sugar amidotransferase
MKFCKTCIMPNTRPGIIFNEDGVCTACVHEKMKKDIDWSKRFDELKLLCDKYRRTNPKDYDCVIAVSGGKDSHYQVYVMKELMNMNPLLVTIEDFYSSTDAGVHNVKNISEAFGCNMFSFKPNRKSGKEITRFTFEKYGRPLWFVDRFIYTVPLQVASKFNIPLVVYGENVSYEYGGENDKEVYSAKEQINNGVASGIDLKELIDIGIPEQDLALLEAPSQLEIEKIDPIYLSYFVEWNGIKNYEFSKSRGFKSLEHEWDRTNHVENFNQIDSIGYLINAWMKFPKFGHAYATDYASRWVRHGLLSREEAVKLAEERDHALDCKIVEDFCLFTGYSLTEFYKIIEKHYNKGLFYKNELNQWRLKPEYVQARRNS